MCVHSDICRFRKNGLRSALHGCVRILLTGHKGYIGAVAGPILRAAGHEVVGLDTDLFADCDFGEHAAGDSELRKDLRDLTKADLEGFDAVVHLAALPMIRSAI